jgi:hydroxyacylglutathione hydrolase
MVLKRFYEDGLAQASYMIGCAKAGECAIIDPNRDIDFYIEAAAAEGLQIVAVTETHIHADYLSGARELAKRTGAKLHLSGEGGADWQYEYAAAEGGQLLMDGDAIRVGRIEIKAVHTPGHTPEHLSFIVTDHESTDVPLGALTGDLVFVGDVGRPDLLERAAKQAGTMEAGARQLFGSLAKFRDLLPDYALIFPGHGSGSACGKALGAVPVSTMGYEKAANWAFKAAGEGEFVAEVLTGQPDPPAYFAVMKRMNKAGPPLLGEVGPLPEFDGDVLPQIRNDTVVIDVRPSVEYARGHVPRSIYMPLQSRKFCTYAGSILPYDRPLSIIADDRGQAESAAARLRLIGLDDVRGWLMASQIEETATLQQVSARDAVLAFESGQATLVDVRSEAEFEDGHAPGAQSIPLGHVAERAGEIDRTRPVAVHCQSGVRSVIACSVLERLDFPSISNVVGGFDEYVECGLPVVELGRG